MAAQTVLPTGKECVLLRQVAVASGAVLLCHLGNFDLLFLMTHPADGSRGLKAVDGDGMALHAGDVLLFRVQLVACGACYLNPAGVAALVACLTNPILDRGVLGN